jgi:flagellar biosynthesis activator protein FlaF
MTPYDAYVNTANLSMSDREIESAALTRGAYLLQACQRNWAAPDHDEKLSEALQFNQKLWSIFEASLVQPDHPLPPALRRDLLRLGLFIDQRIFEIMAYPAPEKLSAIIRINQNLAAGLKEPGGNLKPPQADADQAAREEAVWA